MVDRYKNRAGETVIIRNMDDLYLKNAFHYFFKRIAQLKVEGVKDYQIKDMKELYESLKAETKRRELKNKKEIIIL